MEPWAKCVSDGKSRAKTGRDWGTPNIEHHLQTRRGRVAELNLKRAGNRTYTYMMAELHLELNQSLDLRIIEFKK
ncbi:hypothetical protein NQ317_018473 [Molorchus minor]|uniref:Uncharacterized protein n=1 Tax=Molorchus minor TaxID=1323400 RepID=A0ABQ9ISX2_9CUCU|nr:hypothetical protein NQ317_018473 [Molorchus minor]